MNYLNDQSPLLHLARKSYTSLSCNSISTAVCYAPRSTQIERRTATNPRSLLHQPWKSLSVLAVANRAGCRRLSRDYPISDKWPFRCLAQDPLFRRLGLCDARVVRTTSGIATSRKQRYVSYCTSNSSIYVFVSVCLGVWDKSTRMGWGFAEVWTRSWRIGFTIQECYGWSGGWTEYEFRDFLSPPTPSW